MLKSYQAVAMILSSLLMGCAAPDRLDVASADGVAALTTNFVFEAGELKLTTQITNAAAKDYSNVHVAIEVFDPSRQSLDWRVESIGALPSHSSTNYTTVFGPLSSALMTKEPSFTFEFMEVKGN
jgi:hypothetical protein